MSGSTSKKITLIRFDREPVHGFINPQSFLMEGGIEVLTSSGAVASFPYHEVKAVCFVRDFESGPVWRQNRSFANRPKSEGLWLQLHFRDGDTLEGIIANNLLLFESVGISVSPPDASVLNQKIFVPRVALVQIQVLGVVGSPLRERARAKREAKEQLKMFE